MYPSSWDAVSTHDMAERWPLDASRHGTRRLFAAVRRFPACPWLVAWTERAITGLGYDVLITIASLPVPEGRRCGANQLEKWAVATFCTIAVNSEQHGS